MERAVHAFKQTQVKVEITRSEDCSVDFIIEKLVKVSFHDASHLTAENYEKAMEEFRAAHPMTHAEVEKETEAVKLIEDLAPAPESHEPEPEEQPKMADGEDEEQAVSRVRKKMRIFNPGALVEVWSEAAQRWHDDGEVIETIEETTECHGIVLNAGSMKVIYARGARFKWVDPAVATKLLRESVRPKAPSAMRGNLHKETHGIFTEWHVRYFELSQGFLSWWRTSQEKKKPPTSIVPLLGLSLRLDGTQISFWTMSTKGTMFAISASTVDEASAWAKAMVEHAKYQADMKNYIEHRKNNQRHDHKHHHHHRQLESTE